MFSQNILPILGASNNIFKFVKNRNSFWQVLSVIKECYLKVKKKIIFFFKFSVIFWKWKHALVAKFANFLNELIGSKVSNFENCIKSSKSFHHTAHSLPITFTCMSLWAGLGIHSFQKNVPIFVFFSVLYKRTERSFWFHKS